MTKNEDSPSPGWGASFFMQTTEDVARAVAAAAAAATAAHSPRPSVVFSSKEENGDSQLQRLQRSVTRVLKGFSHAPEVQKSANYNPEVLTSQKRQWASFQLQYLDHRSLKEPSRLFESMVVVGLHPNCDIQALERQCIARKSETPGKLRSALNYQNNSRVEPNIEPQVLFVYPREKQLPLKYKDLLSFCFPGGVEVLAVERTPSMSELNEILLGQEHLKQSDLSFVFRLQVADDSTLYGCCMLVEEIVQKPSGLLSVIAEKRPAFPTLTRHLLTTRRCYCILSRLPFFELHFGVLNSIVAEERLERLVRGISDLDLEASDGYRKEENLDDMPLNHRDAEDMQNRSADISQSNLGKSTSGGVASGGSDVEHQMLEGDVHFLNKGANDNGITPIDTEPEMIKTKGESDGAELKDCHIGVDNCSTNKQAGERCLPNAVLPLLRYYQYESSESSPSFQGSPSEDRNFRSDVDDTETEEASFSGQEDSSDNIDILEWAKANHHGSLQILCEYYQLRCPERGTTLRFHPLDHLHPLEYHRPAETALHCTGSTIDLRSCSSSLEFVEAHTALWAEEEATALSAWTVACICGSLRLENVLTMFAGALLEKQIVVVCSNLGILSASVLSIIPLIRPYRWQSLLMPVLPDDMLDFLDAPVPYIVGVKNKTSEVQSKLTNVILVDANKNQVKAPSIPQLPQHKQLFSSLSPYHAKLVGESYLGKKRPVYECTDVQIEAAKGFLSVLRSYLDSLCSNLRSHTITNVQSNNDKVSLLLKESFIDSFPSRDRPFMKLFVDTQLFSVHTDLVLSFFQKQ
ncbi:DENN domain containing protein [Melia azedarach]|uniref:DENN domain containing protein n=2 Tax=Melia azedarach TaxID=155640 RepID=A0ACC1XES4_MELAZ|nr:DENN domain containing protein [Melia azedarach]KAJ4708780.1 DENN domain containing protein [Melia azedarach]